MVDISDLDPTRGIKSANRARKKVTKEVSRGVRSVRDEVRRVGRSAEKEVQRTGRNVEKRAKNIVRGVGKTFERAYKEVGRFAESDLGKGAIAAAAIYGGYLLVSQYGMATGSTALTESAVPVAGMEGGTALTAADFAAADAAANAAAAGGAVGGGGTGMAAATQIANTEMAKMAATATPPAPVATPPTPTSMPAPPAPPATLPATPSAMQTATGLPVDPASYVIQNGQMISINPAADLAHIPMGGTGASTSAGLIGKAKAIPGFIESHPVASILGAQTLQGMLAQQPEMPNQQLEVEKWRRENSNVGGINYDGSGRPIMQHYSGDPRLKKPNQQGGLISRSRYSRG